MYFNTEMFGGIADGTPDSDYDQEQLKMGTEVEAEHSNNPSIAKQIAKDHLKEIPNYYTILKQMEDDAKKKTRGK